MFCLSTDFYKHNTLDKSSENQEIARTTYSSGPVRVLYSRELLIQLRSSPLSKVVPSATLCDINSLGLKRRFRGRRGGRHHQHHHHEKRRQPAALPNPIPVLTTTRRLCRSSGPGRVQRPALGCELRRANLVDMCQDSYHCPTLQTSLPGVYIINASSIAKPHALDKLNAELRSYHLDIAIITETHFKKHHCASIITMDGYQVFRSDRVGRMRGGTAVVVADRYKAEEYIIPGDSRELELIWIKIHRPTENIYVGALYHPPKPIYATDLLLKRLETTTEAIISEDPNGLLLLGGNFNMLSEQEVIEHTGLIPLIDKPTRDPNILDKFFVSRPLYTNVIVLDSALKTDHRAITATEGRVIRSVNKKSKVVQFRKRSPAQHAELLRRLSLYYDGDIQTNANPILAWDKFYQDVLSLLDEIYPTKNITLTSADPAYLTRNQIPTS